MEKNEEKEEKKTVYECVPFLLSFPFDTYEMSLEIVGVDSAELGVSPILIEKLGTFGTEELVKFTYGNRKEKIILSIHVEDILDIEDNSDYVKQLDEPFKYLSQAISSDSITEKITAIKKSKKFLNILRLENISELPLAMALESMSLLNEIEVSDTLRTTLYSLSAKKLEVVKATKKEKKLIFDFLDFQLHYALIILGIVIAVKIHTP